MIASGPQAPGPDPRVTPMKLDLASRILEGVLPARAYVDPRPMRVIAPAAGVHRAPDAASEQMDQILFGEAFEVLEETGGWAWGQARRDGYVGYVRAEALGAPGAAPTHRVAKVHLRFEVFGGVPVTAARTPAAGSEPAALGRQLLPGRLYVTDRGARRLRRVGTDHAAGSSCIAWAQAVAAYRPAAERPLSAADRAAGSFG